MPADLSLPTVHRANSPGQTGCAALCLAVTVCLGACATSGPAPTPPVLLAIEQPTPAPAHTVAATRPTTDATAPSAVDQDNGKPATPAEPLLPESLLLYAERLRTLTVSELAQEHAALGEPGNLPVRQFQLALVLMHSHQPADTARALGLLQRFLTHPAPELAPLKPLARLLATRLLDQRRLEDVVERQSQQLRDSQRRIELLNDRLEAMRAIERSLTPRGPARSPNP